MASPNTATADPLGFRQRRIVAVLAAGQVLGEDDSLHFPTLTGSFAITVVAQLLATGIYVVALRPDSLSCQLGSAADSRKPLSGFAVLRHNAAARFAVGAVALSHGTMTALMSMTPVHLHEHAASLTVVGTNISLHIAGMFGLSPLLETLADRAGRLPVLIAGQAMLLSSLAMAWAAPQTLVTPSLILLGLGWSASVISGSAMVAESVESAERTSLQGVSDLVMNLTAAGCGALAGPVLAVVGYSGLGIVAITLVAGVLAWAALRPR